MMLAKKKMERTSSGLRESLFEAMEALRNGDIEAQDAKAIAGLAREICHTVSLEIEVQKLRALYPSDAKVAIPRPLNLNEKIESALGE